jgi:hypothetical protein
MTDLDPDRFLDEARGLAFASQSLVFGLISLLNKKGHLVSEEVNDLFEGALQTIEYSPYANDPAGQVARELIDGMAKVAATSGTLKPKTDP